MLTLAALVLFAVDVYDLGSDDFPVREAAQQRLERHDWLAWRACAVGRLSTDLERSRRCDRVIGRALRVDPCPPLIAPLVVQRMVCGQTEWLQARKWVPLVIGRGEDAPPFPEWYLADRQRQRTRAVATAALAAGVPAAAVQAFLDWLARCDQRARW